MSKHPINQGVTFGHVLHEEMQRSHEDTAALGHMLRKEKWTLSVIESVTGGRVAQTISQIPSASQFFLGGVVATHPTIKIRLGRVTPSVMATYGPVSAVVTQAMAMGIKTITQSDVAIAVNGVEDTGLGSTSMAKTVFLSWNIRDKIVKTKRFTFEGGQRDILSKVVYTAIATCLMYVKNNLGKGYI